MVDLLGQLGDSHETKKGYWKGRHGGRVRLRRRDPALHRLKGRGDKPMFPDAAEFHTLRVQPPAGMHYHRGAAQDVRHLGEARLGPDRLHGQSGDIMFQGATTAKVQTPSTNQRDGFDLGGAGPACAPR